MRLLERQIASRLPGLQGHALLLVGVALGVMGCSDIQPVAPVAAPTTDPTKLYMQLTLDEPAINLSTANGYNSIQLKAIPRDATGNAMTGLPEPTFHLVDNNDSVRVQVTEQGLVTAIGTAFLPGVAVVASLTAGPVTHTDTAQVVVQDLPIPPKLASLSIDPVPPDSAIWSTSGGGNTLLPLIFQLVGMVNTLRTPVALDSAGNVISGLAVHHMSLDPAVAIFDRTTGEREIFNPGKVRRVVRTSAYGVTLADTVTYTVTLPIAVEVSLAPNALRFGTVRITPHGYVSWIFQPTLTPTGDTVDITFDDPTNVAASAPTVCGVFSAFGLLSPCIGATGDAFVVDNADPNTGAFNNALAFRVFPEPGIYTYHSVRHPGLSGRVVVTNDPFATD